jgi:hypothetical protein
MRRFGRREVMRGCVRRRKPGLTGSDGVEQCGVVLGGARWCEAVRGGAKRFEKDGAGVRLCVRRIWTVRGGGDEEHAAGCIAPSPAMIQPNLCYR